MSNFLILLALFLLALGCVIFPKIFQGNSISVKNAENEEKKYASREYLLTKCENNFYQVLKLAVENQFAICPMVRLGDLIKNTDRKFASLNRINQKHIDFVLCDKNSMKIVCAIELNDKSHLENDRKIRDDFVSRTMTEANIKFLRIPAAAQYSVQNLRAEIISQTGSDNQENPILPKKGARTASEIKLLINKAQFPVI